MANIENLKSFKKGQSGNPKGRPRSRPLSSAIREAIDANNGAKLVELANALIEKATAGDIGAMRLILERVDGPVSKSASQGIGEYINYSSASASIENLNLAVSRNELDVEMSAKAQEYLLKTSKNMSEVKGREAFPGLFD